jgi:hypothetical protein
MKRWLLVLVLALAGALLGAAVSEVAWGAPSAQGPVVPHEVAGREACLTCHASGEHAVPEDHAGRPDSTCLTCHQPAAAPQPTAAGGAVTPTVAVAPTTPVIPTVVVPTAVPTVAPLPTPAEIAPGEFKGPEFCAQCHKPHIQEWQGSTHATAFQDPVFQQSWIQNQSPGYCLRCHATGYNPNTGRPVSEGVTCESCHGTYKEGHPSTDMMPIDPAAARCGSCHETTYQEWQLSGHAQRNVKCASCHAVHSQGLLFPTAGALCATCHGDRNEDFAHSAHSQENITCANCHMYRPEGVDKTEGKAPTGHFFAIESQACTVCHTRDSIHSRRQTFDPGTGVDVAMAQRVTTLESEIGVLNASVTRNLVIGLAGGAVGGLVLGIILSLLIGRRVAGGKRGSEANA